MANGHFEVQSRIFRLAVPGVAQYRVEEGKRIFIEPLFEADPDKIRLFLLGSTIFQLVRERIGDGVDLRLLSFGCATGEEVFSLRRHFPMATIVGFDINRHNIAVCRSRLRRAKDSRLIFAQAASTAGEAEASYDAIFAMAVFRHGDLNLSPPPPKCDHRLRFADFERSVTDLTRCLKSGGLLVIHNAMFRFGDTRVAAQFEPVECKGHFLDGPLYDRENCSLAAGHYPYVIFRKLPHG